MREKEINRKKDKVKEINIEKKRQRLKEKKINRKKYGGKERNIEEKDRLKEKR